MTLFCACLGGGGDTYDGDISDLMLATEDLPSGYVLEIGRDIESSEMNEDLLDMGYVEGKVVYFTLSNDETIATIGQTAHRYDPDHIEDVFEYIKSLQLESDAEEIYNGTFGDDSFIRQGSGYYAITFIEKDIVIYVFHNGILEEPDLEMLEGLAEELEGRI
ncbi:MAG TPA: hypothetical protein PK718_04700 [Candidatus Methanofastidiosa archaeon]|nr:hypothetical protein [Candidatus Methanofastidiosa archaeon]HPR41830.1 hypothetical protein [Candidatus Methanofastidiosa archaeon]